MKKRLPVNLFFHLFLVAAIAAGPMAVSRGAPADAARPLSIFTPPYNISNSPEYYATQGPRLAIAPDAYLHVTWLEGQASTGIAYVQGQGTSWPAWQWAVPPDSTGHSTPAIALGPDGTVHLVWAGGIEPDYNIWYSTRSLTGTWSVPVDISAATYPTYYPSLAVDHQGGVWVAWQTELSDTNIEIWVRHRPAGGDWEPAMRITDDDTLDRSPSLIVDSSDVPHLAWYNIAFGNPEVLYTRYEGGTWTTPENLSTTPTISVRPRLAANELGDVFVAWEEESGGPDQFQVFCRRWDGTQWHPPVQVSNSPKALFPAIAAQGDSLYVSWQDYREADTEVYFSHSTDRGQTWQGDENVSNNATASYYPDIVAQSCGYAHIVWTDIVSGQLDIFYSQAAITDAAGPLQDVRVHGSALLDVGETGLYTLSYTTTSPTLPVTVTWNNGTTGPTAAYSWTQAGNYTVVATATNACGPVSATRLVVVAPWHTHLPMVGKGTQK